MCSPEQQALKDCHHCRSRTSGSETVRQWRLLVNRASGAFVAVHNVECRCTEVVVNVAQAR